MRFLTALTTLVALTWAQNTCYTNDWNAATGSLANRIGLTNYTGIWKDYTILNYFLLNQWGQNPGSTQNILNVCNAFDEFYGRLYPKGNLWCFSLQNLLQQGADPTSAYSIEGTLRQYSFNCGPGFTTLLHENMGCVQRVIAGYQNTLKQCLTSFLGNMQHDPANACVYLPQYENCFSAPFASAPCRREAAPDAWWACESARRFAINRALNCQNSCDLQHGPPGIADYLTEHHKIDEAGVHHYKIPDYYAEVDGMVTKVEGLWMHD